MAASSETEQYKGMAARSKTLACGALVCGLIN